MIKFQVFYQKPGSPVASVTFDEKSLKGALTMFNGFLRSKSIKAEILCVKRLDFDNALFNL